MKIETRYGTFHQTWWKGAIPSLIVGLMTSAATYFFYRYANAEGLMCGYKLGCPDEAEESTDSSQDLQGV